jgi:hypothetical protein
MDCATEPVNPPPPRTLGTWAVLLAVWGVGLVSWAIYLSALAYLVVKILI